MNFTLFSRKPIQDTEVGSEAAAALGVIRARLHNYGILLAAVKAASCETDNDRLLANFAQDYSMDQVDPIRRIDVLRHALALVERR